MADLLSINQTIRNFRRYAEVISVLVKHGFGDVVTEMHLDRLIERGVSFVSAGRIAPEFERLPRQVRLRKAMEELGPTFIKLGQVLSVRPDLVPQVWADEFRNLQDDCPQVDYEEIDLRIDEEFGDRRAEVLKTVRHRALAAASIAQVHRAVLRDGTHVLLKVLRPGVRELTTSDMEILRTLAHWTEQHFVNLGYSPKDVVDEFARELAKELDLTHEGRAAERFAAAFRDDPDVSFPKVYWSATTKGILAMTEMPGIVLSRLKESDLTASQRRRLVAAGARAVLRQCLEMGFFHADPHPGNLIARPDGGITFIDCGMTGQLDRRTTEQLADLVAAVVYGDVDRVIRVAGAIADVDPSRLEDRSLRADVAAFVSHFEHVPLDQLDMAALLREFFDRLRAHHLRCPSDLVLLIKAVSTIESVGASLDPAFELIEFGKPYIEKLVKRQYGYRALRRRFLSSMTNYAELLETLPVEIQTLLAQLRRNRLAVNIEHRGLTRLTNTIEHASRNISFALILAAMLVGSSILVLAARDPGRWGLYALGICGFVVAFALTVLMIISNRRLRKDDR